MRRNNLIILLSTIFLVALIFTGFALEKQLFPGDLFLSQSIQSHITAPLTQVMIWISWLFEVWRAIILTVLAALLVWRFIGRLEALTIVLAGIITLFNYALKSVIDRSRPNADQVQILVQEYNNGFPSSHAFFTTIFLGMLAYLLFIHAKRKYQRILSIIVPVILILLVGFSRIYLGVHWTSDVIGGYLFGGFFLILLIYGYREWNARTHLRSL
jgi:undecaprenyl-diphosphatase